MIIKKGKNQKLNDCIFEFETLKHQLCNVLKKDINHTVSFWGIEKGNVKVHDISLLDINVMLLSVCKHNVDYEISLMDYEERFTIYLSLYEVNEND